MKELLLYSGIYSFTAEEFINKLNEIPQDEDITVRLNSPGGSVFAGWGIIAALKERTGKTFLKVDGNASSMAFFLMLFFGDIEALDVTSFMIHRATAWVQTEDDQKMLDDVNKTLRSKMEKKFDKKVFEEVAGISIKDLFENKERRDIWLNAKEAKKIGLIDRIKRLEPKEIEAINKNLIAFSSAVCSQGSGLPLQGSNNEEKDKVNININKKGKKMTIAELKENHPELYAEIHKAGATAEKDRIEAWMAFSELDLEACKKGISEGENVNQKTIAEMSLKAMSQAALGNLKVENVEEVVIPEETKKENEKIEAEKKNFSEAKAEVFGMLGLETEKK